MMQTIARFILLVLACAAITSGQRRQPAAGPLRVLESNPRWFTDGSGRAVYLAGSHIWQSLQDNGLLIASAVSDPPPLFDYNRYLDFLERHNHNFFRLWRWEVTKWTDNYTDRQVKYNQPNAWMRSGPGLANDGKPRFDLRNFDPEYFRRLRTRVQQARDRGIYVAVMLFEGWELQFTDGWRHHPFGKGNNINDVDGDLNSDGSGLEFNTLSDTEMGKLVAELQRAYVRKVIDTVNDLDNVVYEIANEALGDSTEWQYSMIRFIKEYEKSMPKQHPVGMTFQYKGGTNAILNQSPADWISPNPGEPPRTYQEDPCTDCSPKVVVSDTDHLWGHTGGDNIWVWKSFTRGLNVLFMEELLPSPTWQDSARKAMGQVRRYAERVDLAKMKPEEKLSATRYCLANRGQEYLIFQSNKGEFTVDLTDATEATFTVEWLNINADQTIAGKNASGGGVRRFTTPFPGPAALLLKRQ